MKFNKTKSDEALNKLMLLYNIMEQKQASVDDIIELRTAIQLFQIKNTDLEAPIRALEICNKLWRKYGK